MCKKLEKSGGEPIEAQKEFPIAVLNSLWKVLTNEHLEYTDPKLHKLMDLLDKTMKEGSSVIVQLTFMYRTLAVLASKLGLLSTFQSGRDILKFCRSAVDDHVATFQEDNMRDFIDVYLKEKNDHESKGNVGILTLGDMSWDFLQIDYLKDSSFCGKDGLLNLENIALDLFFAGSETTTTTLNWCMLYMAKYPEIQKKVQDEIDDVTGKSRDVTMADRARFDQGKVILWIFVRITVVIYELKHSSIFCHMMKREGILVLSA